MITDDMELVRQYAAHQSESAFAALVSLHANLVYSASLRRVRDPQLAEAVTQAWAHVTWPLPLLECRELAGVICRRRERRAAWRVENKCPIPPPTGDNR